MMALFRWVISLFAQKTEDRKAVLAKAFADPHMFVVRYGVVSRMTSPDHEPDGDLVRIEPEFEICCHDPPNEPIGRDFPSFRIAFKARDSVYRAEGAKLLRVHVYDAQDYIDWRMKLAMKVSGLRMSLAHSFKPEYIIRLQLLRQESERMDLPFTITETIELF